MCWSETRIFFLNRHHGTYTCALCSCTKSQSVDAQYASLFLYINDRYAHSFLCVTKINALVQSLYYLIDFIDCNSKTEQIYDNVSLASYFSNKKIWINHLSLRISDHRRCNDYRYFFNVTTKLSLFSDFHSFAFGRNEFDMQKQSRTIWPGSVAKSERKGDEARGHFVGFRWRNSRGKCKSVSSLHPPCGLVTQQIRFYPWRSEN